MRRIPNAKGPRALRGPSLIPFNPVAAGLTVKRAKTKRAPRNLWSIQPDWQGETAFIVAGGTSVKDLDLSKLRGRRVIVVNSSYESYPAADILFFADVRWFEEHKKEEAFWAFKGRRVTVSRTIKDVEGRPLLDRLTRYPQPGLASDRSGAIAHRTSLQGAMNVAAHKGVARIVLLGADMRRGADGVSHHHKPHKWKNRKGDVTWDVQMTQLVSVVEPLEKLGIEVINVSPISRIPWWPKMTLDDALKLPDRVRKNVPRIRPTAYSVEALKTSPIWSRAWAQGCGGNFVTHTKLEPGPVAVFGKPYAVLDQAWKENRDWYYGDHAYFRRFKFYRVTKNAYMIEGNERPDFARWKALGLEIKPWQTNGRHVLVCPPDPVMSKRRGINDAKWIQNVRDTLAKNTSRPVRWRGHPHLAPKDAKPCAIQEDLQGAWAVVTHISNVSVDALLAGVPVFVTGDCPATIMAEVDLAKIESPLRPDNRAEWAAVLAANQWSMSEIRDGTCWRAIGER